METKKCIRCNIIKPIDDFYIHKQMKDGHINVCKECVKNRVNKRYTLKIKNEKDFIINERNRTKEKYHRLNYGNKYTKKNKNNSSIIANTRRKFINRYGKIDDFCELHHFDYNKPNEIIIITKGQHALLHNLLLFDEKSQKFFSKNDKIILDSYQDHINLINNLGEEYEPKYLKME